MLEDVNPLLVAAAGELPSTKLRRRLRDAVEDLGSLGDEDLDDEPHRVVGRLVAKYRVPATAYRDRPTVLGPPREPQAQVADWPEPARRVSSTVWDYMVAVAFDGDAELLRASLASCVRVPRWQVEGNQIRAVFTVDPTLPGPALELRILDRFTDAVKHLEDARDDIDGYHDELVALLEDMVPKVLAMRLAGQRQRAALNLPFVDVPEHDPIDSAHTTPAPRAVAPAVDADPDPR
jgi:hypothetical protein